MDLPSNFFMDVDSEWIVQSSVKNTEKESSNLRLLKSDFLAFLHPYLKFVVALVGKRKKVPTSSSLHSQIKYTGKIFQNKNKSTCVKALKQLSRPT